MKKSIANNMAKVRYVLDLWPETRDDDMKLFLRYMDCFHGLRDKMGDTAYAALEYILLCTDYPAFESITRCRRHIQSEGEFQGNFRKKRLSEEREVRKYFREGSHV